jgi:hypothetical protein
VKHSVELETLALHTKNILVVDSEQRDDNFLTCDITGCFHRSQYVALLVDTSSCESHGGVNTPATLSRREKPTVRNE